MSPNIATITKEVKMLKMKVTTTINNAQLDVTEDLKKAAEWQRFLDMLTPEEKYKFERICVKQAVKELQEEGLI